MRSGDAVSWNPARAAFHALSGVMWVAVSEYLFSTLGLVVALAFFLLLFGADDLMRVAWPHRRPPAAEAVFALLSRPSERHGVASATWYTLALLVGVATMSRSAWQLGTLVLAFADPMASLVGRSVPSRALYRRKSVAGSAAFFVIAFALAASWMALRGPDSGSGALLFRAGLIACSGTIAEALGDRGFDNFTIMVATGWVASVWI